MYPIRNVIRRCLVSFKPVAQLEARKDNAAHASFLSCSIVKKPEAKTSPETAVPAPFRDKTIRPDLSGHPAISVSEAPKKQATRAAPSVSGDIRITRRSVNEKLGKKCGTVLLR